MTPIFVVPIHLDSLYVQHGLSVVQPMADFSRAPYFDGSQDVNASEPNISESLLSTPLEDTNLHLKAGVHLHWALPDGLTRGTHAEAGTLFPAVPNRWLVTRLESNNTIQKQWVVESDYISPVGGGVTIPWMTDSNQPYRYLGRQVPLTVWAPAGAASYLPSGALSAVGPLTLVETMDYVKASFAAFYPNCYSVFGFWDADITESTDLAQVQYEVMGWYSDATQDALQTLVQGLGASPSTEAIQQAITDQFGWHLTDNAGLDAQVQLLCYAKLDFSPQTATPPANPPALAIGNTGTEALSAYLAAQIDPAHKLILEEQLECLQLSPKLEGRQLDIGAKFQEARHDKGFRSLVAGVLWTIKPEMDSTTPAQAEQADPQALLTLPPQMAHALNQLNLLQQAYEQGLQDLDDLRRQIFADWSKYMQARYPPEDSQFDYPDPDEIEFFLENSLSFYQTQQAAVGQLTLQYDPQTNTVSNASSNDSGGSSDSARLAAQINSTLAAVNAHNQAQAQAGSPTLFRLRAVSAARYWQANNPVVLMTGEAARFTERHGQDGDLQCDLILDASLPYPLTQDAFQTVRSHLGGLSLDPISTSTWVEQPWNPFLLEWEVEFFPTRAGSNIDQKNQLDLNDPGEPGYRADFISTNYTLPEQAVDLSLKPGQDSIKAANVYRGFSILTPHAGIQLKNKVTTYLREQILADFCADQGLNEPAAEELVTFLDNQINAMQTWYEGQHPEWANDALLRAQDPVNTALQAYERLTSLPCLSQALGGFNDGLIMQKQSMTWPIADPFAFSDSDKHLLTPALAQIVGDHLQNAPLPFNDFNPIRAGLMRLLNLRLVDTFGQFHDLGVSQLVTTEQMQAPQPDRVALPPRLAQPARLNFRWLSAEAVNAQDEPEMNVHPATSPVCGWLMPNNLDDSLMIYDQAGQALGSIDEAGRWEAAPGGTSAVQTPGDISNPHLQRLVTYLLAQDETFNADFLSTINSALEGIEPESFAQHEGLALLMGRAIAVVRASLSFDLLGQPAIHQGWSMLRLDMQRNRREHDAFTKVQFPVRLGEYQQLNDGLVGYWREGADQQYEEVFYALESTAAVNNPKIQSHGAADPFNLWLSLDTPPQKVTMLLDPRGKVHATSGIVPTKALEIPPDQYTAALAAMEVTFLTAPILSQAAQLELPLPAESGYAWSWLEKTDRTGDWSTIPADQIGQVNRQATFSAQPSQIREGWLKLSKSKDGG